jgi:hypothetical protein
MRLAAAYYAAHTAAAGLVFFATASSIAANHFVGIHGCSPINVDKNEFPCAFEGGKVLAALHHCQARVDCSMVSSNYLPRGKTKWREDSVPFASPPH